MSGRKSGNAARNRAANTLTHAAKTISFASGSDCLFSAASADPLVALLRLRQRKRSVLTATLISGIRRDGLAISDSDDSLLSSGKAPNRYADEL
jgi:hypothetical protein